MSLKPSRFNALAAVRMMNHSDGEDSDEDKEDDNISDFLQVQLESQQTKPLKSILKRNVVVDIDNIEKCQESIPQVAPSEPKMKKSNEISKSSILAGRGLAQVLAVIKKTHEPVAADGKMNAKKVENDISSVDCKENKPDVLLGNSEKIAALQTTGTTSKPNTPATTFDSAKGSEPFANVKKSMKNTSVSSINQSKPEFAKKALKHSSRKTSKKIVVKISGVSYDMKANELISFLGIWPKNGLDGMKFICDTAGDPSGYVYIELDNHQDKMSVIRMSGMTFKTRIIQVTLSSWNSMALEWMSTQRILQQIEQSPFIRVGNLAYIATRQEIVELFCAHGYNRQLEDVYCHSYKHGQQNSGFAYVIANTAFVAGDICSKTLIMHKRRLSMNKVHPELVSRWCRRNNLTLTIRDCVKFSMAVDVPVPELESESDEEVLSPVESTPQPDNAMNSTYVDALDEMRVKAINQDPTATIFVYDESNLDAIDSNLKRVDDKFLKEVKDINADPRSSVVIYDSDNDDLEVALSAIPDAAPSILPSNKLDNSSVIQTSESGKEVDHCAGGETTSITEDGAKNTPAWKSESSSKKRNKVNQKLRKEEVIAEATKEEMPVKPASPTFVSKPLPAKPDQLTKPKPSDPRKRSRIQDSRTVSSATRSESSDPRTMSHGMGPRGPDSRMMQPGIGSRDLFPRLMQPGMGPMGSAPRMMPPGMLPRGPDNRIILPGMIPLGPDLRMMMPPGLGTMGPDPRMMSYGIGPDPRMMHPGMIPMGPDPRMMHPEMGPMGGMMFPHVGPMGPQTGHPMMPAPNMDPRRFEAPMRGMQPTVYVRMYSVPDQATAEDVKEFFAPILPAKIAQNVGYDIYDVDFYTPEDALMSMRRHGMMMRKNSIKLEMLPGPPVPLPPRLPKAKKRKAASLSQPAAKIPPTPPTRAGKPPLFNDDRKSLNVDKKHNKVVESDEKAPPLKEEIKVAPFPANPFNYHLSPFNEDHPEGQCMIQLMEGYFCQLCRKFYKLKSAARDAHCKTKQHYDNLKNFLDEMKANREEEEKRHENDVDSTESERLEYEAYCRRKERGEKSGFIISRKY